MSARLTEGHSTDLKPLDELLGSKPKVRSDDLIPLLQEIQKVYGYLPPEVLMEFGQRSGIPVSQIYGVATFYTQFYLTRQGQHKIKVCQGTACHVRGSHRILQVVKNRLGIGPGETTQDYNCSLERVACFGSCALAPVMVVDGKVDGRMTPQDVEQVLEKLE